MKGSDYLEKFIKCLRESADGTGTGHTELAESLEKASRIYTQTKGGDIGQEHIPGWITIHFMLKLNTNIVISDYPSRNYDSIFSFPSL